MLFLPMKLRFTWESLRSLSLAEAYKLFLVEILWTWPYVTWHFMSFHQCLMDIRLQNPQFGKDKIRGCNNGGKGVYTYMHNAHKPHVQFLDGGLDSNTQSSKTIGLEGRGDENYKPPLQSNGQQWIGCITLGPL